MSERVLSEERTIDEGITTATLAGLNEKPSLNGVNDTEEREGLRFEAESDGLRGGDVDAVERNVIDRTAKRFPSTAPAAQRSPAAEEQITPLYPAAEATELHSRWDGIQVGFVDEPRRAVEEADALVAGAMKRLAEIFAEERARLEAQWDRGDSVSTEDLRVALRRYRSFFGRVLSV